jgi:hypothetical protein
MCFKNQHSFTQGSSTTIDAMPLSLRCACGAMSREDIAPLRQLQAENARLTEQLRIATERLQAFSDQRQERYPGEMGTFAHDALIQISVVE